ncbi:hypothetical protein J1605_002382 [Eschrichtius robustus]|uniref:PDZ domain-containing protein n=1 Tax=Eschrichtius robustus TaxID=9764 RepID=A0AB34HXX3_ESCRO|nr:hypothetical protein J1605_002382 [Eschrichtius robustus]
MNEHCRLSAPVGGETQREGDPCASDCVSRVNDENVVKVGHRQVVNMIRQGGNHLVLKVVTVTRNLDPDDTARKKAPPPPKRAPTTALTLRSKSMTSELEELGKCHVRPAPALRCRQHPARQRAGLSEAPASAWPSACSLAPLLAPDTRKGVRKRPRVRRSHAGPLGSCRLRGWVPPEIFPPVCGSDQKAAALASGMESSGVGGPGGLQAK